MRRAPQLGQNPRFLQEKASSRYSGLPALRPSGQPTAVQIRSRRICPHGTARTPRAGSRARARRSAGTPRTPRARTPAASGLLP